MTSNLDNQLGSDPNLNTVTVSLQPFNKDNNAYTLSFSPLLGDGTGWNGAQDPQEVPCPGAYSFLDLECDF